MILEPPKIKSLTVSTVAPSICHEVIAGRNINNLRYADDTTFMAESKEELKGLLKVKKESENAGIVNASLSQHHVLELEIAQLEFYHLH